MGSFSGSGRGLVRQAVAAACCVLVAAACCGIVPGGAYGYYDEFDMKNSAQQDMGQLGERIPASAVPEGVYEIDANSSSRMCVIYNSAQDAAEMVNKWHATLVSEGGQLSVTFFLSKSYTDIYLGTAEEAASLSEPRGTDDSPYVQGDPYEVVTADGARNVFRYTLAVPSLNTPIVMAAFDGGGADGIHLNISGAKWYNRQVVFIPSQELIDAMSGGSGSQGSREAAGGDALGPSAAGAGQVARGSGPAQVPQRVDERTSDAEDVSNVEDGQVSAKKAEDGARRGTLLVPAAWAAEGLDGADLAVQAAAEEQQSGLSPAQVLGIVVLAALAAGAALRVALFAASKRA